MVNPSQANSPDMKDVKVASAADLLCVSQGAGARTLQGAGSPIMGILQSELQRNMQMLRHQDVPAYFGAYTVYDEHSTQIVASFGAVERSDENHQRFATVEVRVGDYALDNTHPIRGDARAMGPRLAQVTLPLTDDEKPIRLAMWRATDRTYKTATEALTRVKTNVAAKVKDDDPAPDFSREDAQTYSGSARHRSSIPIQGRPSFQAARRACFSTRSSATAWKAIASATPTMRGRLREKSASPCCRRF